MRRQVYWVEQTGVIDTLDTLDTSGTQVLITIDRARRSCRLIWRLRVQASIFSLIFPDYSESGDRSGWSVVGGLLDVLGPPSQLDRGAEPRRTLSRREAVPVPPDEGSSLRRKLLGRYGRYDRACHSNTLGLAPSERGLFARTLRAPERRGRIDHGPPMAVASKTM